jgi:transcriptional regulatory protein LevR
MKAKLEERLGVQIPGDEAALVAVLFMLFTFHKEDNIPVLVIIHGYQTAT